MTQLHSHQNAIPFFSSAAAAAGAAPPAAAGAAPPAGMDDSFSRPKQDINKIDHQDLLISKPNMNNRDVWPMRFH